MSKQTKKSTKAEKPETVCTACQGQPEGMCSRCQGEGMDPEITDCSCDCCGGSGDCDACGGTGKASPA